MIEMQDDEESTITEPSAKARSRSDSLTTFESASAHCDRRNMDDSLVMDSSQRFRPSISETLPEEEVELLRPERLKSYDTDLGLSFSDLENSFSESGRNSERFATSVVEAPLRAPDLLPPRRNPSFRSVATTATSMEDTGSMDSSVTLETANDFSSTMRRTYPRRLTPIVDELASLAGITLESTESPPSDEEEEDDIDDAATDCNVQPNESASSLVFGSDSITITESSTIAADTFGFSSSTIETLPVEDSATVSSTIASTQSYEATSSSRMDATKKYLGVGSSYTVGSSLDDSIGSFSLLSPTRSTHRTMTWPKKEINATVAPSTEMNGSRFSSDASLGNNSKDPRQPPSCLACERQVPQRNNTTGKKDSIGSQRKLFNKSSSPAMPIRRGSMHNKGPEMPIRQESVHKMIGPRAS